MAIKIKAKKEEVVTVLQLLSGAILKGRRVSKSGKASAVVFVPSHFLGQKVSLILIPEKELEDGLKEAFNRQGKRIGRFMERDRNQKQEILRLKELVDEGEPDSVSPEEDSEDEDAY